MCISRITTESTLCGSFARIQILDILFAGLDVESGRQREAETNTNLLQPFVDISEALSIYLKDSG